MITEKFRRQLRKEAKLWQTEELISDRFYQQLAERYQFDALEETASARFITILISLGGILLGLGIITFVSANWQQWSRELKTLLLLTLFILVNTCGFYLWRQPINEVRSQKSDRGPVGLATYRSDFFNGDLSFAPKIFSLNLKRQGFIPNYFDNLLNTTSKKQRLGHGLLIFGALILGANIALMAQMFHIGGSPYGLYIVWGLGVLVMAYSLQLESLGIMAILLIGLGYFMGLETVFYSVEFSWLQGIIKYMALVAVLLLIPLAYWCSSKIIFFLATSILLLALEISLWQFFYLSNNGFWGAIALTLPLALLWGYDDTILPKIDSRFFQPLARSLAIWYLSIGFLYLSFRGIWSYVLTENLSDGNTSLQFSWLTLIEVLIFIGFSVWEWFNLARTDRVNSQSWQLDSVSSVILGFIVVTTILCFWHLSINEIPEIATFIINIEMFLLGAGLIRIGLMRGIRGGFWGGLLLLTLQILCRTFEYNTELLLKSFVFILCGVGVIAAGLWFERYLLSKN